MSPAGKPPESGESPRRPQSPGSPQPQGSPQLQGLAGPQGLSTRSLPPGVRSPVFSGLTEAAAQGRLELQQCARCAAVQYPPREACHRCLSVELRWTEQSGEGELISQTTLLHSHDEFFRQRMPWRVGLVRLSCGPIAVTHLHASVGSAPTRVRVVARLDKSGQGVLIALPSDPGAGIRDDEKLRDILFEPESGEYG